MRKVLSLFLVATIVLGFGSCTKEAPNQGGQNPFYVPGGSTDPVGGGDDPAPNPLEAVGEVPADFTKKVLIEEATGEWCPHCPPGAAALDALVSSDPTAIGVAVHQGDFMEISYWNHFDATVGISGFPSGSVDRGAPTSYNAWAGQVSGMAGSSPACGIAAVSEESGGMVDLDVFVGYNASITTPSKISVMVTEDNVAQSAGGQRDAHNIVTPSWQHQHVLRGLFTNDTGNDIKLDNSSKYTMVSFEGIDLSSLNVSDANNAHLVIFVHSADGKTVLNTQSLKLNETKKWD
jgi:hypothetical protein